MESFIGVCSDILRESKAHYRKTQCARQRKLSRIPSAGAIIKTKKTNTGFVFFKQKLNYIF
jgi:hypothetical protein